MHLLDAFICHRATLSVKCKKSFQSYQTLTLGVCGLVRFRLGRIDFAI